MSSPPGRSSCLLLLLCVPPLPGPPSYRAAHFAFRFSSQPVLYLFYAILATYLSYRWNAPLSVSHWMPVYVFAGLPFGAMSALKFGEAAMDVLKSVPALSLLSLTQVSSP
jgi:hypothetical protein